MTEAPQIEHTRPAGPSSKSLSRYDGPRTVDDLAKYSLTLAVTTLPDGTQRRNEVLPAAFRGNPAGVAFAVEYARALDLSPVTAIIGIHMVDGKPTASAGLISALVRRAGHRIRTWTEGSITEGNFKATTTIERFDDPGFVYESVWDLPRAVRAGLMKRTDDGRFVSAKERSAWATYPENMCKARTITEASRDAAEDAILGVHYTPEELGAETDENGDVVYTVTTVPPRPEDMQAAAQEAAQRAAEAMRDTPAPETPAEPSQGDTPAQRADRARDAIVRATTREQLTAAWSDPAGLGGNTEAAKATLVGDEWHVEISLYDLFGRAVEAVTAGTAPLLPPDDGNPADTGGDPSADDDSGAVDAVIVEEPAAAAGHRHPADVDCERTCPAYDPWPTNDNPVQSAQREVGAKLEAERQERIATRDAAADDDDDHVPSVQIGDARYGVAVPANANAVERAEAVRHLPIPDARAELDKVMADLPKIAQSEVIEWAKSQGMDPTHSAGNCSEILKALATGVALSDATMSAIAAGDVDDPIALLIRVLGGEVVSTEPHRQAERHAAEMDERLREDHVDASTFTVAHRGTAMERSQAARQAARDAVKAAQK